MISSVLKLGKNAFLSHALIKLIKSDLIQVQKEPKRIDSGVIKSVYIHCYQNVGTIHNVSFLIANLQPILYETL